MNYYKQGDAARAKEIKAAFESKGYDARQFDYSCGLFVTFNNDKLVHYISSNAQIANIFETHPDYKELELPKPHYDIKNFKPFDKVLARDTENEKWVASLFSNFEYGAFPHKFVCIDTCYTQCIPFEGNEHLLGTTDMCSEEYINW